MSQKPPLRERIARIVDPDAFGVFYSPEYREWFLKAREIEQKAAYAKADSIIEEMKAEPTAPPQSSD